jgi:hypothetical protein
MTMLNATKYSLIFLWKHGLTKDSNTGKCSPTVLQDMGSWRYNMCTDHNLVHYVSFTTIRNIICLLDFLSSCDHIGHPKI